MKAGKFKVTEQHIKLVKEIYLTGTNLQINEKRPFGNSDWIEDILRILEIKPILVKQGEKIFSDEQEKEAEDIFIIMPIVLEILIRNLSIEPIEYEHTEYMTDWTPVKP